MRSANQNRHIRNSGLLILMATLGGMAWGDPPPLNTAAGVNPADFRYTTFASGLNFPVGMQQLSDGSILVGTSNPLPNQTYYNSTGSLLRFTDSNHDGVADNAAGTVVYSGLPGVISSVTVAGNLVFVTSSAANPTISVLQMSSPTSYTLLGTEQFSFPNQPDGNDWEHTTYVSISQPTPGSPGSYDLYFNIGSQADNVSTPPTATVGASGVFNATLHGASIYRLTINESSSTPTFSNMTQIAQGLRNSAGLAFQPSTGNLYLDDNGIDNGVNDPTYTNTQKEYSADEMNMIPANQVGTTVPDFGFAHSVILESDGSQVGDGLGVQPLQTFRATANGAQTEGPNEIAFAPSSFPAGLNNGIFVTFSGNGYSGTDNDQNALVYYDPTTNQYFHFIESGQDGLGHIDGVLSTDDGLFLSDMATDGSLYDENPTPSGAIYELVAIPEPGFLTGLIGAAMLLRRRPKRQ
ncbi:MAG TPA: hypothetical protein VGG19_01790 [Tepidisphaeraceae bacterium]|jgi:glucose/arabinose dehydrogenase